MKSKKIVIGGGVALLIAFFVVDASAVIAKPSLSSSAISAADSTAMISPHHGSYLRTLWFKSNQFGSGLAWRVIQPSGSSVEHLVFTSINGKTVETIFTPDRVKVIYGAGSLVLRKLANGRTIEHVFVRPGTCQSQPGNIQVAIEGNASVELNANGHPIGFRKNAKFLSMQRALSCRTSVIRNEMRSFMTMASMPVSPYLILQQAKTLGMAGSNGLHANLSGGCEEAIALLVIATAALVSSGGLDPWAWLAYLAASSAEERDCNTRGVGST